MRREGKPTKRNRKGAGHGTTPPTPVDKQLLSISTGRLGNDFTIIESYCEK